MLDDNLALDSARAGDEGAFARLVAPYRRELRAHCYRMSGSIHDADDLLQDSLLRAWRGLKSFEGRSSLRTWLYKITTRACLDALDQRAARVLPMELGPAVAPGASMSAPRLDPIWIEPAPAELYGDEVSPEARYGRRESVALAFLVALQLLPAKQRVVLILHDVLGWQAAECAELLELSEAAINSALQRARQTVATRAESEKAASLPIGDAGTAALLARYVEAWELADVSRLVSLLREDATLAMPPLPEWIAGAAAIGAAIDAMVFAPAGRGAFRLIATEANGLPAFAAYQLEGGELRARAIHVLEIRDGRIASMVAFLDAALFQPFGLPSVLPK